MFVGLSIVFENKFMNRDINNRLKLFLAYKKLNNNELAKLLNYNSQEKIARLFRDDQAKPSYDILFDLSNKFEELNIDWLINGRGEMLNEPNVINEDPERYGSGTFIDHDSFDIIKEQLSKKDEIIEKLIELLNKRD